MGGECIVLTVSTIFAMLFWAGLRGAVGVALAAGMTGLNAWALKATVLVVVVLTVIIFGGTTARMLEILGIRTGVVEELDSDDEFDIEAVPGSSYYKHAAGGYGNVSTKGNGTIPLSGMQGNGNSHSRSERASYISGNASPIHRPSSLSRKGSASSRNRELESDQDFLHPLGAGDSDQDSDSDLPPAAARRNSPSNAEILSAPYPTSGQAHNEADVPHISAGAAFRELLHGSTEDHAAWFRQLDEGFIKPKLLLDGGKGPHGGPS